MNYHSQPRTPSSGGLSELLLPHSHNDNVGANPLGRKGLDALACHWQMNNEIFLTDSAAIA
jgi:hypothetical protein